MSQQLFNFIFSREWSKKTHKPTKEKTHFSAIFHSPYFNLPSACENTRVLLTRSVKIQQLIAPLNLNQNILLIRFFFFAILCAIIHRRNAEKSYIFVFNERGWRVWNFFLIFQLNRSVPIEMLIKLAHQSCQLIDLTYNNDWHFIDFVDRTNTERMIYEIYTYFHSAHPICECEMRKIIHIAPKKSAACVFDSLWWISISCARDLILWRKFGGHLTTSAALFIDTGTKQKKPFIILFLSLINDMRIRRIEMKTIKQLHTNTKSYVFCEFCTN